MARASTCGFRISVVASTVHRTKTIDYVMILPGEIDMLLDASERHLKAGDVVVQHGTNHARVNRSDLPCSVAFVLIDAK